MSKNKYITSESIEINRSQIEPAKYNPRKISEEAKKKLKANIKRMGVMGGIVWNKRSGRLVGGHQKLMILDELQKYDRETKENDYLIRVEAVDLSDKEEIEQNIFLNNKNAQGEFDNDILSTLLNDIEVKNTGLDDFDLNLLGFELPSFEIDEVEPEPLEEIKPKSKEEKKEDIKAKKEASTEKAVNTAREGNTYVMLSFNDYQGKEEFMKRFDLDPNANVISGDEFAENIERIY
ncbi:ParB N-terminal domain-containing protein [Sphingobacterium multivorum]|uniref:ParB N-terminal domain-containing protein n=1 Tax=Sphingobacterium multivorum TaxID=28454 RepID=UPI003DA3651E